jgi:murein DD-endopeptidase MepM/ murein hydrolase activator NlpD
MNIRYLSISLASFLALLAVAAWASPGLFNHSLLSSSNKASAQDKKHTVRSEAAGQASPFSFGNEVEFETSDGIVYVYINNRLAGPMQVQLSAGRTTRNMDAQPALPVTFLLEPRQRKLVTRLQAIDAGAPMIRDLQSLGIPGDPHAIPDDLAYSLPVDENSRWELGQEFNGEYSHNDEQNRYAVDFIVPVGTPVLAARSGIVMETIGSYDRGGQNAKIYASRANFIRILHDDGSMALYAHLKENGVLVSPGEQVGLGDVIGYSGNTGFSSGPHLHFVLQINAGMRLVSIPFRMVGPQGILPLSQ